MMLMDSGKKLAYDRNQCNRHPRIASHVRTPTATTPRASTNHSHMLTPVGSVVGKVGSSGAGSVSSGAGKLGVGSTVGAGVGTGAGVGSGVGTAGSGCGASVGNTGVGSDSTTESGGV